ncbi:Pho80p cyclin [Cryptotrichosporon argae]
MSSATDAGPSACASPVAASAASSADPSAPSSASAVPASSTSTSATAPPPVASTTAAAAPPAIDSDAATPSPVPALAPDRPELPWAFINCPTDTLVVLIAHMLDLLCQHNDQVVLTPDALTRFHSRAPPGISVVDYLRRVVKYTSLEKTPLLSLLAYIDLTCQNLPTFTLSSLTVHRFLIAGVTAGSKAQCDVFCTNGHYAKVGGIKPNELNSLEREFLRVTEWALCCNADLLQRYYSSLIRSHGGFTQAPEPQVSPFRAFPRSASKPPSLRGDYEMGEPAGAVGELQGHASGHGEDGEGEDDDEDGEGEDDEEVDGDEAEASGAASTSGSVAWGDITIDPTSPRSRAQHRASSMDVDPAAEADTGAEAGPSTPAYSIRTASTTDSPYIRKSASHAGSVGSPYIPHSTSGSRLSQSSSRACFSPAVVAVAGAQAAGADAAGVGSAGINATRSDPDPGAGTFATGTGEDHSDTASGSAVIVHGNSASAGRLLKSLGGIFKRHPKGDVPGSPGPAASAHAHASHPHAAAPPSPRPSVAAPVTPRVRTRDERSVDSVRLDAPARAGLAGRAERAIETAPAPIMGSDGARGRVAVEEGR